MRGPLHDTAMLMRGPRRRRGLHDSAMLLLCGVFVVANAAPPLHVSTYPGAADVPGCGIGPSPDCRTLSYAVHERAPAIAWGGGGGGSAAVAVSLARGVYAERGLRVGVPSLTVRGMPGASVLNCGGLGRGFTVPPNASLVLSGLSLVDCVASDGVGGGGVLALRTGALTVQLVITDCVFSRCSVAPESYSSTWGVCSGGGDGGGVLVDAFDVTVGAGAAPLVVLSRTSFDACTASSGGGTSAAVSVAVASTVEVVIDACSFVACSAEASMGGAVAVASCGASGGGNVSLVVTSTVFSANFAEVGGGAIALAGPDGVPAVPSCCATGTCGEISPSWTNGIRGVFTNCSVSGNTAGQIGAGLYLENATAHLVRVAVNANVAGVEGGGAMLESGTATLHAEATSFTHNSAAGSGGQVLAVSHGDLMLTNGSYADMQPQSSVLGYAFAVFDLTRLSRFIVDADSVLQCSQGSLVEITANDTVPVLLQAWSNSCPVVLQRTRLGCSRCPTGTYLLEGGAFTSFTKHGLRNPPCLQCPYGGNCTFGSSAIVALQGFWGAVDATSLTVSFVECEGDFCCTTPADCTSVGACVGGRAGQLCGSCLEGYGASLFVPSCVRDEDCSAAAWAVPAGLGLAAAYAAYFLLRPRQLGHGGIVRSADRLVAYYIQMALLVRGEGSASGSRATWVTGALGFVSMMPEQALSASSLRACVSPGMSVLGSLAFGGFAFPGAVAVMMVIIGACVRGAQWRERVTHGFLPLALLSYSRVLSATFALLSCVSGVPAAPIDASFVSAAGTVACWAHGWQYGMLIVLFVVILAPVVVFAVARGLCGRSRLVVATREQLVAKYKPQWAWWEAVLLAQLLLLHIISAFLGRRALWAHALMASVAVAAYAAHTNARPFDRSDVTLAALSRGQAALLISLTCVCVLSFPSATLASYAMAGPRGQPPGWLTSYTTASSVASDLLVIAPAFALILVRMRSCDVVCAFLCVRARRRPGSRSGGGGGAEERRGSKLSERRGSKLVPLLSETLPNPDAALADPYDEEDDDDVGPRPVLESELSGIVAEAREPAL